MTTGLRSGEVAAAAGVNPQTLRYYERRGLLPEPARTLGGQRLYPPDTVTLLRVIKAAQRLGFTLEEVTGLVDAATHRHGRPAPGPQGRTGLQGRTRRQGHAGLHVRAAAKLAEVEQKITDLRIIRDTLRAAMDAGCDDLIACAAEPRCPLPFAELAGADPAGATGPGRRDDGGQVTPGRGTLRGERFASGDPFDGAGLEPLGLDDLESGGFHEGQRATGHMLPGGADAERLEEPLAGQDRPPGACRCGPVAGARHLV